MKVVTDYGPIKNISVPDGWQRKSRVTNAMDTRTGIHFHPFGEKLASIELFYRGAALSKKGAAAFREMLADPEGERELSGDEIISITEALGNIGNNQYTYSQTMSGAAGAPWFNMLVARVTDLNGRRVLCVSGNFQGPDRKPTKEFYGIFTDLRGDGEIIYELYFETSDKVLFVNYLHDFQMTLNSIVWSD